MEWWIDIDYWIVELILTTGNEIELLIMEWRFDNNLELGTDIGYWIGKLIMTTELRG